MDIEERLTRIESIEKIRLLKAHYCDLCDEGYDADALANLFTEDGVWDGGELGRFEGREQVHQFFTNMPKAMSFAIHHVTNSAIEVDPSCETAKARWYLLQTATTRSNSEAIWIAGRYDDELVRVDDDWLFKRIAITTRFVTPHLRGWADLQFADLGGKR